MNWHRQNNGELRLYRNTPIVIPNSAGDVESSWDHAVISLPRMESPEGSKKDVEVERRVLFYGKDNERSIVSVETTEHEQQIKRGWKTIHTMQCFTDQENALQSQKTASKEYREELLVALDELASSLSASVEAMVQGQRDAVLEKIKNLLGGGKRGNLDLSSADDGSMLYAAPPRLAGHDHAMSSPPSADGESRWDLDFDDEGVPDEDQEQITEFPVDDDARSSTAESAGSLQETDTADDLGIDDDLLDDDLDLGNPTLKQAFDEALDGDDILDLENLPPYSPPNKAESEL